LSEDEKRYDDARLRPILGYIGLLRDSLRMQNWDIILHQTVCDEEDVHAKTWQDPNHATLNVELGEKFFEETPVRVRSHLTHELVHAQHRDVSRLWEDCTQNNSDVPESQAKAWDGDFHVFLERFVSWITARIVPTMPEFDPEKTYEAPAGCFLLGEHIA